MKKRMQVLTIVFAVLTSASALLAYTAKSEFSASLAITSGTFFYHLAMRLLTGNVIDRVMRNHADLDKKQWRLRCWERKLYKAIKVKEWKGRMPTFDPDVFDKAKHSWEEIAEATCQAETVHTLIFLLSYVPLLFTIPFGSFPVFLITSILASFCDLPFIIIQRYNRDRMMRLMRRQKREPCFRLS